MNFDRIISQRSEMLKILGRANEVFCRYKVDFDYIKHSKKNIENIERRYKFNWAKGVTVVVVVFFLSLIIDTLINFSPFLPLLAICLVYVSKYNTNKMDQEKGKILSEVARRFSNIKKQHDDFEYQDLLHIKYVSPDVVQILYSYIEEGRADSLKEAINLMHSENQNNQMLRKQEEILNGLNSASKKDTVIGVATIAAILLSGAATRHSIRS